MACNFIISEKSIIIPGENCVFPTSRKDKGISLFKVPTPDKSNSESIKWTKDLMDVILKYRVKDESLIKRMHSYKQHIQKVGPETRDFWWDPRIETRDPSHRWNPRPENRHPTDRWYPRPETRDPESGFSKNFLSFL